MQIQLKKWGNSLGLRIPHQLATRLGLSENSTIQLIEKDNTLVIKKKRTPPSLKELVDSAKDFRYPDDVADFAKSAPVGRELI